MESKLDTVNADGTSVQLLEKEERIMTDGLTVGDEGSGSRDIVTKDQCDKLEDAECEEEGGDCTVGMEVVEHSAEKLQEGHSAEKLHEGKSFTGNDACSDKKHIREGRRCGLCGRGTDGRPPKRLVRHPADSDNELYGGTSSCEEATYDILDGFGDEPGWLGRLLGPIHDRFGIADVWVHHHCAVWSPEVYFAGLGCLKNVRAALCRGKALKCSRCERPGATIGCRVDRCPKTYHLPCGRADGCIFDHRKFLIACNDHRNLFEPHRNNTLQRLKKLKVKKLMLETRKLSHDAWRKDCEAEEKWLENCGEDEEFLKREGKRLHRDILRIAPVYIGGTSTENQNLYQGWDSVAGLQDVIQCMKEVVLLPLLYPEFFSNIGLAPPRGVLLHGYPGTGKTHVVRALIGSCARGDRRIAYFARKGADCLGKYVGDAERQLRLLFQVAERSQPSIIFFDEIDGLAPCRTRQQDQTHNSVVSTLLALMDGLKSRGSVIVIGATNRPDAVDPALRRPGRFDREIYFPLPSVKDRAAILSVHTRSWSKPISGSLLKWIAQKTAGFAGADLQALCTQAAMIALKRNCPLQELMLAAEKKANDGRHIPLPSCSVEETDWLDALACAPPPCSRREAGMAANDVIASPLHTHLVPCLLQPLSYLLVSLHLDERVWLPPFLHKAAKLIKVAITSALDQREKSSNLWWSYLPDLIKEADVAREIERALLHSGLLAAGSSFVHYNVSPDDDSNNDSELCKVSYSNGRTKLLQNVSCSGRESGFRVLITGHPKSGQRHLASCLLHGFVGCVEIQKVDLATFSQEGRGDIVEGMASILLKCSSMGRCIIYMPRIDLWALELETQQQVDEKEDDSCVPLCVSANTSRTCDAKKTASHAWNSFMEQVDSICVSASIIILATSEVPSEDLPFKINQFFTSNAMNLNNSTSSESTMPRFIVQLGGSFDCDMVINSSATQLSRDLVQQYVELLHCKTHATVTSKENKAGEATIGSAEFESHNILSGLASEGTDDAVAVRATSNSFDSCDVNRTQKPILGDDQCPTLLKTTGYKEEEIRLCHSRDAVPRVFCNNKIAKGKSGMLVAVTSFGYQILQYPQFAELCWTTSKLKEGPYADVNGPWKGWPFNSCVVRPDSSLGKVSPGRSFNNPKNKDNFCVVRGLIAVGLLAYRGVYTSIREVSFEVRKVLELLVEQINAKILAGKDRYQFLNLLSQVAYLEDIVNSWAYTLQSLERDTISPGAKIVGHSDDHCPSERIPIKNDEWSPIISQKIFEEEKVAKASGFVDSDKGITCLDMPCEARLTPSEEPLEEIFPSVRPFHGSLLQTSTSAVDLLALDKQNKLNNVVPEERVCVEVLHGRFGTSEKSSGLAMKQSVLVSEADVCNHDELSATNSIRNEVGNEDKGLSVATMALPSNDNTQKCDEFVENMKVASIKKNGVSSVSRLTCLYHCCLNCIDSIYVLIRRILICEWKAIGSSWTVEDVHDVVCSWSTNLLSAIKKLYAVESMWKSAIISEYSRHETSISLCTCSGVDHRQLKGNSDDATAGQRVITPVECSFHSKSKDVTVNSDACTNSEFRLGMKFCFKDNVLIPSDIEKDVSFHCKFENLCLSSLIEWILMIKQPLR
ncbi:hypothetical protein AQUCO_03600038v1 [Aquilegia coerulea]|uniref:PHD-type domain-containing protein n=1 Tax=Aquilegia coerulea TaxID=218851 RepID=A0A2G5CW25_AQUCA|nr:hypothetical protein AQUCO_03600038v1 [Aquilegia coerulea]